MKLNLLIAKYEQITLKFKTLYQIEIYTENDIWFCDIEEFKIHAMANTASELLYNIQEWLIISWKLFVLCDISELHESGIILRRKLLDELEQVNV